MSRSTLAFCTFLLVIGGGVPLDAQTRDPAGPHVPELSKPVRVEIDGVPIDTGDQGGHAGVLLYDFDRDGKTDILVTSFQGYVRFGRNVGTNSAPRYVDAGLVEAEGAPLRFHNW